ncbi:hypothetical protein TSOC_000250 [Tetrabaena socialis]|uniref:Uncharacterized protein n=1 Tax=Tetrabaena socialis TaxID=47790 RepID=A0A2J8AJU6_9CHLO|nr:hypothetical protein TSOC_000250 [Tetrabaena socialis]|eukprot:PNH12795.1 hypothetical protein TSOC_000250 [Tetrabaena socialis]
MNPDALKIFDDIGFKLTLGVVGTAAVGSALVLPSAKQVEAASQEMYGCPPNQLLPADRKAAEFCAGFRKFKGFMDNNIYKWTRTLPGHDNPFVNPYRGPRKLTRKPEQQLEQELESASKEQ